GIDDLGGHAGWASCVLPRRGFQGGRAYREGRRAFLDEKDLLIGMLVQFGTVSRRHIHHDHTDAGVSMLVALELIGVASMGELIRIHDGEVRVRACHLCLLCLLCRRCLPLVCCAPLVWLVANVAEHCLLRCARSPAPAFGLEYSIGSD